MKKESINVDCIYALDNLIENHAKSSLDRALEEIEDDKELEIMIWVLGKRGIARIPYENIYIKNITDEEANIVRIFWEKADQLCDVTSVDYNM